jgi:hypothetical protein
MKHIGKLKTNSAKVIVVYRTLPNDPHHALVVGTQGLPDIYHDSLMSVLESDQGQQANELADVLAVRKFPDGTVMLGYLHSNGHLSKISTKLITMTPNNQTFIPLDELNQLIADQKGVLLEDLAVTETGKPVSKSKKSAAAKIEKALPKETENPSLELTPAELRSRASDLLKESQRLKKIADELDPPKSKKKKVEPVE